MEKYSANYAYTNHNFTIQNIKGVKLMNSMYYPIFCVLKNILHRGSPTIMSSYLQSKLGQINMSPEFNDILVLIDKDVPKWKSTIKGDDDNNQYPAKDFYEKYIPKYLKEYIFIQQLILPEVPFTDIIGQENKKFANQQVDFYLPQAKLVIEIDGQQHKKDDITRFNDGYRDEFLRSYGIEIVRISTTELFNKDIIFQGKIEDIKSRLDQFKGLLNYYKLQYKTPEYYEVNKQKFLTSTAVMRFQTLILSLLEKGIINITDSDWNFNILCREVGDFAEIAVEDIFIWLEHLCKLKKIQFKRPRVNIHCNKSAVKFKYKSNYVNVDFSILKRWTDEDMNNPKILFVRTDYYDRVNYFRVSTSDPIKYSIIEEGEDSDVPTLEFFLENIFGFDEFRPGQLPIIISALGCNDTIGLLPTGSGKSLCYQLSALLQPCISFIVCPIKSLMYDQKDNLDRYFITHTNFISSDQSASEKRKIGMDFESGKYFFVWISPERFQIQEFRDYLGKLNKERTMALAVIDEVHCLSEWGHDFRTSYLNLVRTIRDYCPSTWFLGLTATASSFVLEDLKVEFDIVSKNIKTLSSFTRKELKFHVIHDKGTNSEDKKLNLYSLLSDMSNDNSVLEVDGDNTKSGLIFTLFKNGKSGCYKLSNDLSSEFNSHVKWYSGEVPTVREKNEKMVYDSIPVMDNESFDKYKMKTQSDYKENLFPLLVATKAFGMGIDKKNIRYTVHYGIPSSLEALYQEAGRAGRDRQPADCYVLYSKETLSKDKRDKLFDPNTKIDEIRDISKKQGYEGRDVLNNFFLWLSNNQGIEEEAKLIKGIYSKYGEPNKVKLVKCKEFGYSISFSEIQKAIYRLSIIGIVQDWTIESWNKGHQIIKVVFTDFTEESMTDGLLNYINRYDKEFVLDRRYKDDSKYGRYSNIYYDDSISNAEKLFLILVEWTYENIIYNRRQSIKNIYELCENFTDGETFKNEIEKYFKFTDKSYILDSIAQNPRDYIIWFDIFYNTVSGTYDINKKRRLIDKKEVEDIKGSISRLLESYRYNTGLNFISGIVRLILDDYENQDGKTRLESAFQQIVDYDQESKLSILDMTLKLKYLFSEKATIELSKLLCEYYPDKVIKIYDEFNDSYSLGITLEDSLNKLKSIGVWFS